MKRKSHGRRHHHFGNRVFHSMPYKITRDTCEPNKKVKKTRLKKQKKNIELTEKSKFSFLFSLHASLRCQRTLSFIRAANFMHTRKKICTWILKFIWQEAKQKINTNTNNNKKKCDKKILLNCSRTVAATARKQKEKLLIRQNVKKAKEKE